MGRAGWNEIVDVYDGIRRFDPGHPDFEATLDHHRDLPPGLAFVRPDLAPDVPVRKRQFPSREIRRLGLADWPRDAEAPAASIAGRSFDERAQARQSIRRDMALRLLAEASNRRGRAGVPSSTQ